MAVLVFHKKEATGPLLFRKKKAASSRVKKVGIGSINPEILHEAAEAYIQRMPYYQDEFRIRENRPDKGRPHGIQRHSIDHNSVRLHIELFFYLAEIFILQCLNILGCRFQP